MPKLTAEQRRGIWLWAVALVVIVTIGILYFRSVVTIEPPKRSPEFERLAVHVYDSLYRLQNHVREGDLFYKSMDLEAEKAEDALKNAAHTPFEWNTSYMLLNYHRAINDYRLDFQYSRDASDEHLTAMYNRKDEAYRAAH
jgi:hypothetical protein